VHVVFEVVETLRLGDCLKTVRRRCGHSVRFRCTVVEHQLHAYRLEWVTSATVQHTNTSNRVAY